jgi:hypothetical protein
MRRSALAVSDCSKQTAPRGISMPKNGQVFYCDDFFGQCKSFDHTYRVGDQVFDLPSQQIVTILEIRKIVNCDTDEEHEEELQSVKPSDGRFCGDNDFFTITVDAPADFPGVEDYPHGHRTSIEICLPEEAERYRGFDCLPSAKFEAEARARNAN